MAMCRGRLTSPGLEVQLEGIIDGCLPTSRLPLSVRNRRFVSITPLSLLLPTHPLSHSRTHYVLLPPSSHWGFLGLRDLADRKHERERERRTKEKRKAKERGKKGDGAGKYGRNFTSQTFGKTRKDKRGKKERKNRSSEFEANSCWLWYMKHHPYCIQ